MGLVGYQATLSVQQLDLRVRENYSTDIIIVPAIEVNMLPCGTSP
jgi:hypothetical protein